MGKKTVYDLPPMCAWKKNQNLIKLLCPSFFDNKTLHVKRAKILPYIKHQIVFSAKTPSQEEGSNIKEFSFSQ